MTSSWAIGWSVLSQSFTIMSLFNWMHSMDIGILKSFEIVLVLPIDHSWSWPDNPGWPRDIPSNPTWFLPKSQVSLGSLRCWSDRPQQFHGVNKSTLRFLQRKRGISKYVAKDSNCNKENDVQLFILGPSHGIYPSIPSHCTVHWLWAHVPQPASVCQGAWSLGDSARNDASEIPLERKASLLFVLNLPCLIIFGAKKRPGQLFFFELLHSYVIG
jgi:hypothetical protein